MMLSLAPPLHSLLPMHRPIHGTAPHAITFIGAAPNTFRLTPRLGHTANVQMVAHCLIWAQRFDRLLSGPSRAQGLQKLASAIQGIPVLPDYQPPAAPAGASGPRTSPP
jgi:hypothetical protein